MTRRRIAVIGGGISGLTAGYILSRTDEVTALRGGRPARRSRRHAPGRRARRPAGGGRHRVHRLQRADLPAADPAVRRARGGDAGLGDEHVGQLLRLRRALRGQARPGRPGRRAGRRRSRLPADAGRGPEVPPGRPAAAGVGAAASGGRRARLAAGRGSAGARLLAGGRSRSAISCARAASPPTSPRISRCRWSRRCGRARRARRCSTRPRTCSRSSPTTACCRSPGRPSGARWRADRGATSSGSRPGWRRCGSRPRFARSAAARTGSRCVDGSGAGLDFDAVVIATHPDQALRLLDAPTAAERSVLGAFGYTPNEAVLHTDTRLLPPRPAVRASWNYALSCHDGSATAPARVSYHMNRLQGLPTGPGLHRHARRTARTLTRPASSP